MYYRKGGCRIDSDTVVMDDVLKALFKEEMLENLSRFKKGIDDPDRDLEIALHNMISISGSFGCDDISRDVIILRKLLIDRSNSGSEEERDSLKEFSGSLERIEQRLLNMEISSVPVAVYSLQIYLEKKIPIIIKNINLSKKSIDVSIDCNGTYIDQGLLRELDIIFIHLLRNSIDHGFIKRGEGKIQITSKRFGDKVTIDVLDDGKGIDVNCLRKNPGDRNCSSGGPIENDLEIAFREGSTTRKDLDGLSGMGLGLHTIRKTIEGLNGDLELKSPPGGGTIVRMNIPIETEHSKMGSDIQEDSHV